MPAIVALIARATCNFVVLRYLVAYRAVYAIGIAMVLNPFKTNFISGELGVKIFGSVLVHFSPLYTTIIKDYLHVVKG
jgi:hypothetical protein